MAKKDKEVKCSICDTEVSLNNVMSLTIHTPSIPYYHKYFCLICYTKNDIEKNFKEIINLLEYKINV